ncbi:MAG: DUF4432 family protein [Clostridia bacterium]|nr:DUF4432 family protein [Clostridia bacterium]
MNLETKEERLKAYNYIGNTYQIGGTRHYRLSDGPAHDCKCIDVRTGSGFEYTVVCDRGLDISLASYKGLNLVHLTAGMETNPAAYDPWESEWLRTFSAGLLTTCGPNHLGNPCEDQGQKLGLHGRWSSLAGRQVADLTDFHEGKIEITGRLYEMSTFGYKIAIRRSIKSEFGKSYVVIEDEIQNQGGQPAPLTMLYHINFGYPFLDENAIVNIPSKNFVGNNTYTIERLHEANSIKKPDGNSQEKNYAHTFNGETVCAYIHNPTIGNGIAAYVRFDSKDLPHMTQWVYENIKDYVAAIEPANVLCEPRSVLREKGMLPELQPGETKKFRVEIGIAEGKEEINNLCK